MLIVMCLMYSSRDSCLQLCIRYIVKYLDVTNVCEALQASVNFKLTELRDKALQYIENNTQGVMRSKNFLDLNEEAVCVILDSDEVYTLGICYSWNFSSFFKFFIQYFVSLCAALYRRDGTHQPDSPVGHD